MCLKVQRTGTRSCDIPENRKATRCNASLPEANHLRGSYTLYAGRSDGLSGVPSGTHLQLYLQGWFGHVNR